MGVLILYILSACRKYGMKIMINIHALPGSQNGMAHSAPRDGTSQDWGKTEDTIQQSVEVIDFLAARYTLLI